MTTYKDIGEKCNWAKLVGKNGNTEENHITLSYITCVKFTSRPFHGEASRWEIKILMIFSVSAFFGVCIQNVILKVV
jgi:hypothetical protein